MRYILVALACSQLIAACKERAQTDDVVLVWDGSRATGVQISAQLIDQTDEDVRSGVSVVVEGQDEDHGILGQTSSEGHWINFTPVVPFTNGMKYHVYNKGNLIATFTVPESKEPAPVLSAIYPSADTVPENLLKMYLQFSKPMQQGRSLSYISVLRNNLDTVTNTFLDLQPELWNADGTMLTLWLDPGRIKRDLIPNKELGNPLEAGGSYTMYISGDWKSTDGRKLPKSYSKSLTVSARDENIPVPEQWTLKPPKAGTKDALRVVFHEALDYMLVMEAIQIRDSGTAVSGTMSTINKELTALFVPDEPWRTGVYHLSIESRLEDLAGNNLNRLFDRNIETDSASDKKTVTLSFSVN